MSNLIIINPDEEPANDSTNEDSLVCHVCCMDHAPDGGSCMDHAVFNQADSGNEGDVGSTGESSDAVESD